VLEELSARVPEQNAEHLKINDPFQKMVDALEQIIRVEDTRDLARDIVKHTEGLSLPGDACIEAGVLYGDRHARGNELEKALMLDGEVADGFRLEIKDAYNLVLDDEGNCQFRTDGRIRVDVILCLCNVIDEKGPALQGSLTDDTPAELDAHAFYLTRVADLEAHAKIFRAIVDEKDGEDFVVDDGPNKVSDPMHQRVEIKGGVKCVRKFMKKIDLEGFDANLWVGRVGMKERRRNWAIVAFEGMFGRRRFGRGRFGVLRFSRRRHSALGLILPGELLFGEWLEGNDRLKDLERAGRFA
jgi:hypothetical protein